MLKKPRSLLYTPALNLNNFNKVKNSGADVGVFDLEDGVPLEQKNAARENIRLFYLEKKDWLTAVRINPLSSEEGLKDIIHLSNLDFRPDIIILSMLESSDEVNCIKKIFSSKEYLAKFYVTVETPKCLRNIYKIANNCDGLIFGSADYSAALSINIGDWENVLYARSQIVSAAAEANIPSFDTAYFNLDHIDGLVEECTKVRKLGFVGKTSIHPKQIPFINKVFTPSQEEVNEAMLILNIESSKIDGGISKINQKMIGPPFIKLAKKIIARSEELNGV